MGKSLVERRGIHCIVHIFGAKSSKKYFPAYRELRKDGLKYYNSAHEWVGPARFSDKYTEMLFIIDRIQPKARTKPRLPATLCWGCANAALGGASKCAWARDFTPVEGWKAKQTELGVSYSTNGHTVAKTDVSYCVLKCPLFEVG